MDYTVFVILFFSALVMELIDSGLGMMYGTILSPILLITGYDVLTVVPSILLSQACGGFIAIYQHNKFKNADFKRESMDLKIAGLIFGLGIIAIIIGAFVGTHIPKTYLKTYIGILCIIMGSIVLLKGKFIFSWMKISLIGGISAFNKALSGGGFGPIVASGQIASGVETKKAIGITDFAEAPICLVAFISWMFLNSFQYPPSYLIVPLCIGASIGGIFGPFILFKAKSKRLITILVGILAVVSGLWVLYKVLL